LLGWLKDLVRVGSTHILSESSKDNTQTPHQTHYQLNSHLQSNTLELDDKAQTLSYEHYYPHGGTAIIAGKGKTQVRQKRYRYTNKERDDSSGLCYYGARYLAPWLARWISPDSAMWVPMCKVALCCFVWLIERSSAGR
jgi:RHS repeat-associated protein